MAIDGTYDMVVGSPLGPQERRLVLKTFDNELTGTATGSGGSEEVREGTVKGNVARFTVNAISPFGPIKLDFALTFDGDTFAGVANSMVGALPVQGKRA